uniref:Uncharacterized protein n=1 Tax=viral metagenome TaxID=1070528 RepID=A0A6C0LX97_9ZZZZ
MLMLLKNYFNKLKKRFIQKRDDLSKKEYLLKKEVFSKRESLLKRDAISSTDAILQKKFERNMQRLFDKYKNI